jgi:hypothetical protein
VDQRELESIPVVVDDLLVGTVQVVQDVGLLDHVEAYANAVIERWDDLKFGGIPDVNGDVVGVEERVEWSGDERRTF